MPFISESASWGLTEYISAGGFQTLEELFECVAFGMQFKHISYLRFPHYADRRVIDMIVTYPLEWQSRYSKNSYYLIDPVVTIGCERIIPFDWAELRTKDAKFSSFFDDAFCHGVGRNGVSIPVRNREGGLSIISFTSDDERDVWLTFLKGNMAALQTISAIIDSAVSFTRKTSPFPASLSQNEKKYLARYGRNSNINDIARECGASENVVGAYLDTARHKLRCINLSQAVVFASATGAISLDEFD
jgi:LuxR family transcriptional regulator, quorum-sensing system regulator CinR